MKNEDLKNFETSLKTNNKKLFNLVNKADLHNHAVLSSNRKIFYNLFPDKKLNKFIENNNIFSLSEFIKYNLLDLTTTKQGQLKLFEATILTAIDDGITILDTSVDYRLVYELYENNIQEYIKDLIKIKEKYKNNLIINFDLGISRNENKKEDEKIIIELIKSKIFNGIDLFGDEKSKPIQKFKKIYKIAKKNNLVLKVHVGEFGSAKDIYRAIKLLKLNVIQHGISIVESEKIMKYAKKNNIYFNVCPISNLKLKRIDNIKMHPIKKMFDFGLNITINTDDQLIFENSLFDEYYLLYKNNLFTIEELNQIRLNSLKKIN